MQNRLQSGGRLGRQALLFPLCLVLYEFSTYIGNDMISRVCWRWLNGIGRLDWVPAIHDRLSGGRYVLTVAAWPVV